MAWATSDEDGVDKSGEGEPAYAKTSMQAL